MIIWIDIKTTGFDILKDLILEVSICITDCNLNIRCFMSLYINQSSDDINNLLSFNILRNIYKENGMIRGSVYSKYNTYEADKIIVDYIKANNIKIENDYPIIYNNKDNILPFIKKYFPKSCKFFSDKVIDISTLRSIKSVFFNEKRDYITFTNHTGFNDINNNINEFEYYKYNILSNI